ncbi:recombinase family protein [uncultured Roseobacter sp.]|uniref:recombinase family protein n=1 Tax=uncultured Roseobacter sp. TaxID=114847 RepID=UPI002630F419|nr:recombinase family protein [uncultured Roseobacter sp.]
MSQNAITYCRVSSVAQVEEGHGLESQETRCREYATRKGYAVIESFYERAVSGGVADRPSFNAMLSYIKAQKDPVVVVIDDISRLARDIESHWALRRTLEDMGGKLESPSLTFGEDSDSILVENLLASVSQHQRQKNGEQTKNRMRARVMNGYWVSHAPVGFKYEKVKAHGKLLVRDEPLASIVQEALEGFASGRFETQAEVKRFLESQPDFPKTRYGHVTNETVNRILNRPHYAGYIEFPNWDVSLRKGHHEGLISLQTFEAIQSRLNAKPKAAARPDLNADFPLRGFVLCDCCGNPMTACWSKSKTGKRHPYYSCFTKGCESYRKSIKRDDVEGAFEAALHSIQPSESGTALLRDMLSHAWDLRGQQVKATFKALKRKLCEIETQTDALLDRIVESSNPRVVSAYEAKIDALEKEKLLLDEKLQNGGKPQRSFEEMFELACRFLSSPWKIWKNGDLTLRRTVLKLTFDERLRYCRKEGLRTPKTTLPFSVLGDFCASEGVMAERQSVLLHAQRWA